MFTRLRGYRKTPNSGNSTIKPNNTPNPINIKTNLIKTQKAKDPSPPSLSPISTPSSTPSSSPVSTPVAGPVSTPSGSPPNNRFIGPLRNFRGNKGALIYPKRNATALYGNFVNAAGVQRRVSGSTYEETLKKMRNEYTKVQAIIKEKEEKVSKLQENIKKQQEAMVQAQEDRIKANKKAKELYEATIAQQKEAVKQKLEEIKTQQAKQLAELKEQLPQAPGLLSRLGLKREMTPEEQALAQTKQQLASLAPKKRFGLFGGKTSTRKNRKNRRSTRKNRKNRRNTRKH